LVQSRAGELADRLHLPLAGVDDGTHAEQPGLVLAVTPARLELRDLRPRRARPIYVDFVGGPTGYRRIAVGGRRQPLARAAGIRGPAPTVLDATAGLCRDAFLLAALGCTVLAVERSAALFALAEDGMIRAKRAGTARLTELIERIRLIHADAKTLSLPRMASGDRAGRPLADRPDVVYLDPMYPVSPGSAEVKREMRVLRELVGGDLDAAELFAWAKGTAKSRVVVKRLRHSPPLGPEPSHTIVGTRVRYDVYLT
jgi:16S rRNA (guanine1516-N2)-methyltransferase